MLRVVVAHDLHSGMAIRPEWGPMYGPEAVSEQKLLERAICRLPERATVIGDCNFGVFSVAYSVVQSGHPVLLRLTMARAQRLAGEVPQDGIDRMITWNPSLADRRSHPELPHGACVRGQLIVRRVQPDNGGQSFLLALFTTMEGPAQQALQL